MGEPWDQSLLGSAERGRRYEVYRTIGQGGMGVVYHARDRALDREVALKFLLNRTPEFLDRFLKEARAAARVLHPNIVALYDIFEGDSTGNRPFLSMEFINGISLSDLVERDGPLPVWQAREFVRQVAIGLEEIHKNGLVHRDIKPANLMVTAREQTVKILDLGLARLTPRAGKGTAAPKTGAVPPASAVGPASDFQGVNLTDDPNTWVAGTPPYMAPEQFVTSHVDIRADIYSLGCTFFVLLTGRLPFRALSTGEFAHLHTTEPPPPIENLRPEVPRELASIVRKMLAKRPEDRYQTPAELLRALERFANPPAPPTDDSVTTADRFATVLKAARLLPAKQLDALDTDVLPKFPDVNPFAAELVRRGWLTDYQVNEILSGRGRALAVGGYVLVDQLGSGAFGVVYRAKQHLQNREVALKVIRPDRSKDHDAVARFRREIDLASRLNHGNLAAVYTADEEGGRLYMVMELCFGESLDHLVKTRSPLPCADVAGWAAQTAAGLQHIYEKKLIHRDLKPSNLMLTATGIKILDLGLARVVSTDASQSSANLTGGNVVGTPDYMSPEQANPLPDIDIDIRSDLYNLGATLYHLIAGTPPFSGTAIQVAMAHVTKKPQPLAKRRADVPSGLAEVVHKLMEKEPADRYQTPAELLAALQAIPA